jgi:hypothetical protein
MDSLAESLSMALSIGTLAKELGIQLLKRRKVRMRSDIVVNWIIF